MKKKEVKKRKAGWGVIKRKGTNIMCNVKPKTKSGSLYVLLGVMLFKETNVHNIYLA